MLRILNIIMFLITISFIYYIFDYYSSTINIDIKNFNRSNIDQILKEKTLNIPVLVNNTDNVIEFNNSIDNEINSKKKRSFWNLLKNK